MSEITPKISVIIPVFNCEKYIGQCLKSVCQQTLQDIQIVVINDGSTDQTEQIVKSYAEKDERVELICQANQGVSVARNAGIRHAKGEYIFFADSDDYLQSDLCQKTYDAAKQDDADVVIFYVEVLDQVKATLKRQYFTNDWLHPGHYVEDKERTELLDVMPAWQKIIRTDLIKEKGCTFPPGIRFEDNYFWWQVICFSTRIVVINEYLYVYRIHPASFMATDSKTDTGRSDFLVLCDYLIDFEEKTQLSADLRCALSVNVVGCCRKAFGGTTFGSKKDMYQQVKKRLQEWPDINFDLLSPRGRSFVNVILDRSFPIFYIYLLLEKNLPPRIFNFIFKYR